MTKTNGHMVHLEYLNACNCVKLFTLETLWIHYRNPLNIVPKQHINYAEPHGIIPETGPDGQETYITHFNHVGTTGYIYHCRHI